MSNSHDEIDISKIIKAMEKIKTNQLFIKKSGKPRGYYAERSKKAKEKPPEVVEKQIEVVKPIVKEIVAERVVEKGKPSKYFSYVILYSHFIILFL